MTAGSIVLVKQENGDYCTSPHQALKEMLNTHFPNHSTDLAEDSVELRSNNQAGEVESFIDVHKVKATFDSFGPHKASGADGLKPIVLQNLPDNIQQWVASEQWVAAEQGIPRLHGRK